MILIGCKLFYLVILMVSEILKATLCKLSRKSENY
jgi:hypothetical protein